MDLGYVRLIRHGRTKGNTEQRYVGRTDEPLLAEEKASLSLFADPGVKKVYVSPMVRAKETAEALFPMAEQIPVEDFRECDFGHFEYRNYKEMAGDPEYQHFIDTMAKEGFPGGETTEEFKARCAEAFAHLVSLWEAQQAEDPEKDLPERTIVAHGGTIMSVLEAYGTPHRAYYEWQVKNACGYAAVLSVKEGRPYLTQIRDLCMRRE